MFIDFCRGIEEEKMNKLTKMNMAENKNKSESSNSLAVHAKLDVNENAAWRTNELE